MPRGAHVMEGDPLLSIEPCFLHGIIGQAPADVRRGAHVPEGDPLLSIDGWAVHAMLDPAPTDVSRGAHVMQGDPLLSIERRALHAMRGQAPEDVPLGAPMTVGDIPSVDHASEDRTTSAFTVDVLTRMDVSASTAEAAPPVSAAPEQAAAVEARTTPRRDAHAMKRAALVTKSQSSRAIARRRWRLVPLAGAAGALALGLGGGSAVAFIVSQGSGSSQATTGGPVTIPVTATTGSADLLPGRAGAAYFTAHNTASSSTTFDQIASGATVVSDNTALCGSGNVSIAQTLPYTLPTPVTVSPGGTSGIQSIANLVALAPNAPSTCQGVTFTVTLTLSGPSS